MLSYTRQCFVHAMLQHCPDGADGLVQGMLYICLLAPAELLQHVRKRILSHTEGSLACLLSKCHKHRETAAQRNALLTNGNFSAH